MSRKKRDPETRPNGLPPEKLERNTLTMSLVIVVLGLLCLPGVEKNGSTWYVLMIVFIINALLLAWILFRIIRRRWRG